MKNKVPPYDYLTPLWSPDGRQILTATWVSSDSTLWQISLKNGKPDGAPRSIHLDNLLMHGKPAWLNDGRSLAVSANIKGASKAQLVQIFLNDGHFEAMVPSNDDFRGLDSVTCPQGLLKGNCPQTLIAAKEDDLSAVWVIGSNGKNPHKITDLGKYSGITWSGNDTLISESEYAGHPDLVFMNANRPNDHVMPITEDEPREKDPAVSPDGRYLVYASNRGKGMHLWRINLQDVKAAPRQLTFSDSVEDQPAISPDGKSVIFTSVISGHQNLWMTPIDGGPPAQVTANHARKASFSPQGKIVCEYLLDAGDGQKKWVIAVLEQDGRLNRMFPDIPTETPVKWSLDGRRILYVKKQNGTEDIWSQPIEKDGGPTTQLTHLGEERIFAFALSPDGSRVACLSGEEKPSQILQMQLAK